MAKNKPTLPPRKWYSLQQAADTLSQIFNQAVTSGDLLHYANQGLLELSVRIDFERINDDEFNFSIHNSNLNDVLDDIYDLDIHYWQGYIGKTDFIKTDRFKAVLNDTFDFEKAFKKLQEDSLKSEDGLADMCSFFSELNKDSIPYYYASINKSPPIDINTNIDKLNGFFTIEFNDFDEVLIDENNPKINLKNITFRASRNDNINNGFGFVIEGLDIDYKQIIELNKDSIFIVPEELEIFANGGKPIRNLNSFESVIEEWKKPTRTMNPDTVVEQNFIVNTETMKVFELKRVPFFTQKNQKIRSLSTIESYLDEFKDSTREGQLALKTKKTDQIIEKEQKIIEQTQEESKKYYERIILKSCMETAKKYPDAGVYSIVSAVIRKIKTDYGVTDRKMFYSERHYVNKLRENGKSPHPQRGKNGKTIEPIIKIS